MQRCPWEEEKERSFGPRSASCQPAVLRAARLDCTGLWPTGGFQLASRAAKIPTPSRTRSIFWQRLPTRKIVCPGRGGWKFLGGRARSRGSSLLGGSASSMMALSEWVRQAGRLAGWLAGWRAGTKVSVTPRAQASQRGLAPLNGEVIVALCPPHHQVTNIPSRFHSP